MRATEELLGEYGESHRNPFNKAVHWICVPAIMFSVLGLLWSIAVPAPLASVPFLNWAVVVAALAMIYYLLVSVRLAGGILLITAAMFGLLAWLERSGASVWLWSLAIFVLAWIAQFYGHHVEGKRPSFFKDVQFLLIGPLWLVAHVYRRLDLHY